MRSAAFALLTLLTIAPAAARQATIPLTTGMVITQSTRVTPGTYRLASTSIESPAITVRGNDITVDLTGVTIEGGAPFADPDTYTGTGILIDGGSGVRVTGGAIRGFKVAVRARQSPTLHLSS